MRKIFLVLCLLCLGSTTIARDRNKDDYDDSDWKFRMRLGYGTANLSGLSMQDYSSCWGTGYSFHGTSSVPALNFSIGFINYVSDDFDLYWGLEAGLGTRGFKYSYTGTWTYEDYDWENDKYYTTTESYGPIRDKYWQMNVMLSPSIGYTIPLAKYLTLDPHVGFYTSLDVVSLNNNLYDIDLYDDNTHAFDSGLMVGIGLWYNHVGIDVTYQRGFKNIFDSEYIHGGKTNNLLVRLSFSL